MAIYQDKLFVAARDAAYCFQDNASPVKIFNQACNYMMVCGNKLFITIMKPRGVQPAILYADLASNKYEWKDISPLPSALLGIHLPENPNLLTYVSARNIVMVSNRILANIVMEIEGSGAATHGGLYVSEDTGNTWERVDLDVPQDVIIDNIVQDPRDIKHIFSLLSKLDENSAFSS